METRHKLEEYFMKFPGIGPRQARRFVYFILSRPASFVNEFLTLVKEARESSRECQSCHRIFDTHSGLGAKQDKLCNICSDASRDHSLLMVVARDSDFESIEKSGAYRGMYFILGGTIPILDKEPERRVRMQGLMDRITANLQTLKEIILSLSTTPEGENTADLVRHNIVVVAGFESSNIKISFLGRGLSTGAELEYADRETIKNALFNRH